MALREFPDALGRIWEAWDTYPKGANVAGKGDSVLSHYMADQVIREGNQPSSVRHQYEARWLTFKFNNERRRLAPIPPQWESADGAALRRYLDSAQR